MSEAHARLAAVVHGRVQGVGFRAHTLECARRLGLSGWVRNRFDGTVETVAEGPREKLELFLQFLRTGPRMAHVTKVDDRWEAARGEGDGFEVRGTN